MSASTWARNDFPRTDPIRGEAGGPVLLAAEEFESPGVSDFWQPLFGTDGAFAVTRASIVMLLSVAVLSWVLIAVTKRMTVIPAKTQFAAEGGYTLVRNSVG